MNHIVNTFSELGGVFCLHPNALQDRLKKIKAFVFDWDGVFNNGRKNEQGSSSFSEVDAMGTNMLRFSYFLDKGTLPISVIMSGEKNVLSFQFGEREHFNCIYYNVKDKCRAIEHLVQKFNIQLDEVAFFYDDVLDLGVAEICGLRILVNRMANPMYKNYVIKNEMADYVTAHEGGEFAVREACELLMGMRGNYDETIKNRSQFSSAYENYLAKRQAIDAAYFTRDGNSITPAKP